jgi:small conductance mechanosensitive channel
MLLLFRPFRLGDQIQVAGKSGVVRSLNIFMTEISGGDNVQVLIPNGQVWGQAITNESAYPIRRVSLTVQIAPKEVDSFVASYQTFIEGHPKVLRTPDPPGVTVTNVVEKGIELSVQAWAKTSDAGSLKAAMIEHLVGRMTQSLEAEVPTDATAVARPSV